MNRCKLKVAAGAGPRSPLGRVLLELFEGNCSPSPMEGSGPFLTVSLKLFGSWARCCAFHNIIKKKKNEQYFSRIGYFVLSNFCYYLNLPEQIYKKFLCPWELCFAEFRPFKARRTNTLFYTDYFFLSLIKLTATVGKPPKQSKIRLKLYYLAQCCINSCCFKYSKPGHE